MKILLIEDDPTLQAQMRGIALRNKLTLDYAADGQTGFEKAQKGKYDAIMLDLKLPKRYGMNVLDGLRALKVATPILIVSSIANPDEIAKGLNHGADGYLTKPIQEKVLVAHLKNLLRKQIGQRKNLIKCQDLLVNLDSYSVFRSGKQISLAKKEFGILIELIKHKNHVLSREQLFRQVWGETDAPVQSNTIDVHIRMLRDKIDKPFTKTAKNCKELIETVRGFGYVIKD